MSSVTSTGMCLWPLCTPKVRPTNCGRMVERRDHILITAFEPEPRAFSAFLSRYPSTNGPFQIERATFLSLLLMAAAQDVFVGRPVVAGLLAFGRLAPRSHWVTSTGGAALAAAMRVVNRVHGNAAHHGPPPLPPHAACLADRDIGIIRVRDGADGRHALCRHHARLARVEPEDRVARIAADELHVSARGARELPTFIFLHLHVVDDSADRHIGERHGVAGLDVNASVRDHCVARREPLRRQDIRKLAVLVFNQRNEGGSVRVIFEPVDRCRHAELVALEVDLAIGALMPAAAMPHRHTAGIVASASFAQTFGERFDRLALVKVATVDKHELTLARRGRFECLERHGRQILVVTSILSPSARRTIAFLTSCCLPFTPRKVLVLPLRRIVFTASTLTPNSCSMAALISGLVASRRTLNTTWFDSETAVAFSVITGAMITSYAEC